jgi:hypothetical protein
MAVDRPTRVCALCAEREATTREHVPAQALFPPPRPNDLITVPACGPCNNGTQPDDDYFFATLALIDEERPSAALEQVRATVRRGLARPRAGRLWRHFADRLRYGAPTGRLILRPFIRIDQDRMMRVVQKHARGVFYELLERPLHPAYAVMVMPMARLRGVPADMLAYWENVRRLALGGRARVVGPEVFEFNFNAAQDNAYVFCARLVYYGNFEYLAQSIPRGAGPRQ